MAEAGFNTLYVVGSKSKANPTSKDVFKFQYIICCWFNLLDTSVLFQTNVSIHYMLLVQNPDLLIVRWGAKFQYIICCWFKKVDSKQLQYLQSFNTLYVVGSTCVISPHITNVRCFNTLYVVGSTIKVLTKSL